MQCMLIVNVCKLVYVFEHVTISDRTEHVDCMRIPSGLHVHDSQQVHLHCQAGLESADHVVRHETYCEAIEQQV